MSLRNLAIAVVATLAWQSSGYRAALALPTDLNPEREIFSTFTPPSTFGGYSSANGGLATQLTVSVDTPISSISIYNEMFTAGPLKFAVMSHPEHQFLHLSEPISFLGDAPGVATWKQSSRIDLTLEAGKQYLIGYMRSMTVNDRGDKIAETLNGIKSDLLSHTFSGFETPVYSHLTFIGVDFALKIHQVPEPSSLALCVGAATAFACRSRWMRRQHP